jgi:hypothetical protein
MRTLDYEGEFRWLGVDPIYAANWGFDDQKRRMSV